MIVVMERGATADMVDKAIAHIEAMGFHAHCSRGTERTVLGVLGEGSKENLGQSLMHLEGVERAIPVLAPYKLASIESHGGRPSTVDLGGGAKVGGGQFAVIAGPCAVESPEQVLETAEAVRAAGAQALRGGAYKPRSSPYSFQGLGEEGLRILADAREQTGLAIVTEVLDTRDVEQVARYADVFQIGARNMQNFALLREVGRGKKPVIVKRGMTATYEEWLMAAEYVLSEGNTNVILCERGIRTFETYTRNTFDVNAIPAIHRLSHLPVIADPSHGTGRWRMVTPMALAAVAAGADGLLVEVHPRPEEARSDGAQSLNFPNFTRMMEAVSALTGVLGRAR